MSRKSEQSTWLANNTQWSDSRKTDLVTYNKYGSSNGGLRDISAQDDTGKTKFWTAICNNGNAGTISRDDGIYCAMGANKESKCTSNFSLRSAGQYLCK